LIEVRYFPAPWAGEGSLYGQVVGQEWINATAPNVEALAEMICGSYNSHHTGEHPELDPETGKRRLWRVDEFTFTEIDPPGGA
jgi:hypothetical protein